MEKTSEVLHEHIFPYYVDNYIKDKTGLSKNYLHFGKVDMNVTMVLIEFLRHNPFFTGTLQIVPGKNQNEFDYHLNSYNLNSSSREWFAKVVETYDVEVPRVNAVFDSKLKLKSYKVFTFDQSIGQFVEVFNMSKDEAMNHLLFLTSYYFQFTHTMLHIYHAFMTEGMVYASKGTKDLAPFASLYTENVFRKYMEVKFVLLNENGGLVGAIYKGNREKVLTVMGDLMKAWGSCQNATEFVQNVLLHGLFPAEIPIEESRQMLKSSGILSEFFKHVDWIASMAQEFDDVFRGNINDYSKTTIRLVDFMEDTDVNGPRVKSISSWIEMMTVTGILHGASQSATRLCMTIPIMKYFNDGDTFDTEYRRRGDAFALMVFVGTIVDIREHLDITSRLSTSTDSQIHSIAVKYDRISSKLRWEYFKSIRNTAEFNEIGWIRASYIPNGIDNQQSPISSNQ